MPHRGLPHIFGRVFNAPLAITPARLEPLVTGLMAAGMHRGPVEATAFAPSFSAATPIDWDRSTSGRGFVLTRQTGVAWVPIRGVMAKREGNVSADSTEIESYARIGSALRAAASDARTRAVLLDIDTPGGEVGGLFELAGEIRALGDTMPVWAIANDDAMSAGYALASAAQQIWVTGVGGVGSIGVVAMHTDQSRFDAAQGIAYTYIHAGARKVDGNSHEPLSEDAHAAIQAEVDRIHSLFAEMVAQHRGVSASDVRATEAAVFYGADAIAAGLADQQGSFSQAVAALGESTASMGSRRAMVDTTSQPAATAPTDWANLTAQQISEAVSRVKEASVVVRLDAVRNATENVRKEASEVPRLCALAGFPALSADFIARQVPLHLVRADLQRRRAEADEARQIETVDTTPKPATAAQASEMSKVAAARFAVQTARK